MELKHESYISLCPTSASVLRLPCLNAPSYPDPTQRSLILCNAILAVSAKQRMVAEREGQPLRYLRSGVRHIY
ncbi:MAG: hypothetical protein HC780_23485 [Leptolyngbyaceae cyanobacterium CSU_1_3]|nr:hypothetical protein [Leptolyngbyaceae cyanobacterium CSU_1_3]